MSASPPPSKDADVEADAPTSSHDDEERMDPTRQDAHLPFEFEVKEQDRWLPIANVARIMKLALPENAKIAKEAKECMQECVSEFISFITSEASEKCQQEKRKTVNGEDILFAMTSLGFENYAEALKIYLTKYRESQSARGENQNRAGSAFTGAESSGGGGGGGGAGTGTAATDATASSSTTAHFKEEGSESANNILSPGGDVVVGSETDPTGYGYSAVVGPGGHNGAGGGY